MSFQFSFLKAEPAANAANQLTAVDQPTDGPTEPISTLAELATDHECVEPAEPTVMKSSRAERFEQRLQRFKDLGLPDADDLAEKLARRDREGDDRTLCLECRHYRASGCARRDAWLPRMLQRCDNFAAALLAQGEAA